MYCIWNVHLCLFTNSVQKFTEYMYCFMFKFLIYLGFVTSLLLLLVHFSWISHDIAHPNHSKFWGKNLNFHYSQLLLRLDFLFFLLILIQLTRMGNALSFLFLSKCYACISVNVIMQTKLCIICLFFWLGKCTLYKIIITSGVRCIKWKVQFCHNTLTQGKTLAKKFARGFFFMAKRLPEFFYGKKFYTMVPRSGTDAHCKAIITLHIASYVIEDISERTLVCQPLTHKSNGSLFMHVALTGASLIFFFFNANSNHQIYFKFNIL